MKQALQFRLGQNLTMTPQLQQAIRLLQLSTLELNSEIQIKTLHQMNHRPPLKLQMKLI